MSLLSLSRWSAQDRAGVRGVLTDIDDTLTTEGAITPDALGALQRLRAAGLPVFAITGRPAGWSEAFALSWPVNAIVAENGAVALSRGPAGELQRAYLQDAPRRRANFERLQAVAQHILLTLPQARLATDSPGRETDIAIDHSEFAHLDEAEIAQVVALMRAGGLNATVSSIHVNGWIGGHDKLEGARWIVREHLGRSLDDETRPLGLRGRLDQRRAHVWPLCAQRGRGQRGALRAAAQPLAALPRGWRARCRLCRGGRRAAGGQGVGVSEHPLPPGSGGVAASGQAPPPRQARLGLYAIFGSTFFELVGYFMLTPFLILRLNAEGVPTAVVGLFAATGWLGVFLMTPFASAITQRLGRRPTLWLAALVPVLTTAGFLATTSLPGWFVFNLVGGMASGLRWVLAEAVVAEFAAPGQRGRAIGIFETMVGTTFVIGPALLAWVGAQNDAALWIALALLLVGLGWSLLIPRLPAAADAHSARVGLSGVWHAFLAHPLTMAIGFIGGFFESGITSILPLYGLSLGLGAAAAALLVSSSGLGSALTMLPAGLLADRLAHHPQQRFGDEFAARRLIMRGCAAITLIATGVIPFVAGVPWLAAPVAFVWGGAGGCLYTMVMIDIGSRETGITLVNSTAVLVLSYTLGGVLAPALGAAALQWSPVLGFPALLIGVASVGCWLLWRR